MLPCKNGMLPVHAAARLDDLTCLQLLLHFQKDAHTSAGLMARTQDGATPLHFAAAAGSVNSLGWLLDEVKKLGLDTEPRDKDGNSPLHHAAQSGHADCLKVLAAHGVALQEMNKQGECPADLAERSGHHSCAQYLDLQVQEAAHRRRSS